MDRLKTHVAGLDEILQGGLPDFATVLVAGAPGSGKTVFCQNILFNVSKNTGRKAIYFSTISEPQIKVLRYQQQFSFFSPDYFQEKVIYRDTSTAIRRDDYSSIIEMVDGLIKEHQPVLVAVDSLKAIADRLPSLRECREFVSGHRMMEGASPPARPPLSVVPLARERACWL